MHLHLPEQVFLQLHLISSLQLLAASGRELQNGTQVSLFLIHPQSLGLGNSGFAIMAWPQTWPAWYTALLACSTSAHLVGGIFSICLFPWEKRCFLASFTDAWDEVLLYNKIMYRSTTLKSSSVTEIKGLDNRLKTGKRWGSVMKSVNAVFVPMPANAQTVIASWQCMN